MNAKIMLTPWRQLKIQLRKTWSELTDEDLETIALDTGNLAHVVQHRYRDERGVVTKPAGIVERVVPAATFPSADVRA